ncbi:hypothetical protein EDD86DRAFT_270105 [Gorgonomyces haynaldii]|nr:hypothetical protein EDD86DRAFT_270105 [Gorgonomyces haynaldii]
MGYQMQIQLHLSQGLKLNALLTKANTVDEIIYAGKTSLSLHLYEDTKALLDKLQSLERDPIQVLDGLFLECFYHLGIGKVKQCQTLLKSLHQMLEDHVDVKSRKQSKRYLLGFLVSGMVHKHSDCKTSKMFLSQGIIRVKTLLQEPLNCEDAQYLADLHTLLLKNLGQVCLLMSNLDEAAQVMIECTHKAMQYDRWTEWQDSIMMDWTLLMQQVGYQDKASILLNKLKTSSNPTVSSVAQSNALLLNMDSPDWSYLLSQMETKTFYSKSIASYLQGMKHLQHQEYQPTKQQMLKTIEFTQIACDTQLQTMCLAILGQLFQNTEPQQALKVRLAGLDMARKKHLPQLVLAIGHDLQSVQPSDTLQQEMNETQEKMEQSKAKAREQLQAAFPTLFQKEQ